MSYAETGSSGAREYRIEDNIISGLFEGASATSATGAQPTYFSNAVSDRTILTRKRLPQVEFDRTSLKSLEEGERVYIEEAFDLISDAVYEELSETARSNCFDDWKDALKAMSRKVTSFSRHHRIILGSLISVCRDHDMSDFSFEILGIFQKATSLLRQPTLSKVDSRYVVNGLMDKKLAIGYALHTDEPKEASEQQRKTGVAEPPEKP